MIFVIVGIVAAVLIALDARKNIRLGSATTLFGTYSREERPTAFRIICGVKLLMSVTLLILAAMLVARNPT
ncbi:hypothetical protein [Altererythrobacter sp. Root672]|uniref:hypothetical protein n=1 Tax=Altererythrobacter sp. Root672 TaxID=1736584 RepID=UPI0007014853|nr:hypothetical protein [Altererythrobacter sp. Root672]KRA79358.1 hypothetical protein ASD76_17435 [Altererythrobacter sp. Root672]